MSSTETLSDIMWRYFRYMKFGFMLVGLWVGLYFFNHCSCRTIPRQNKQMEPSYKPETMVWMDPTIHSQETGLVRGDPVAYRMYRSDEDPEGVMFMGRVIAFGKQRLKVVKGEIFVDGKQVSEAQYLSGKAKLVFDLQEMLIPSGHVYILVDNRKAYTTYRYQMKMRDSRHMGPIMERAILGKITNDVSLKSGGGP